MTKSISAILLLVLKHSKLAHVYQFECWAQHLIFANCVPLILRYFNQNMHSHITDAGAGVRRTRAMHEVDVASLEFPACVLTSSEWTAKACAYSRRNLFASINLLRVLNKLCKWKPARVLMLTSLKVPSILRRALSVRHPMMQLYILKLIKIQSQYLGRGWRRANLKLMTAIYMNVRGRLNDNWAYGDAWDGGSGGWDGGSENSSGRNFEEEERRLRTSIELYHMRRFEMAGPKPAGYTLSSALAPAPAPLSPGSPLPLSRGVDPTPAGEYDIEHVLARPYELSPGFKAKYEQWLEKEVFQHPIDWDEVLNSSNSLF